MVISMTMQRLRRATDGSQEPVRRGLCKGAKAYIDSCYDDDEVEELGVDILKYDANGELTTEY